MQDNVTEHPGGCEGYSVSTILETTNQNQLFITGAITIHSGKFPLTLHPAASQSLVEVAPRAWTQ